MPYLQIKDADIQVFPKQGCHFAGFNQALIQCLDPQWLSAYAVSLLCSSCPLLSQTSFIHRHCVSMSSDLNVPWRCFSISCLSITCLLSGWMNEWMRAKQFAHGHSTTTKWQNPFVSLFSTLLPTIGNREVTQNIPLPFPLSWSKSILVMCLEDCHVYII